MLAIEIEIFGKTVYSLDEPQISAAYECKFVNICTC